MCGIAGYFGKHSISKEYINRGNEIQKAYNRETLKEKIYDVPVEGGKVIKLTGDQVVRNINYIVTKWIKKVHGWMTGERDIFGQYEWQRSYSPLKGKYKNYAGDFHMAGHSRRCRPPHRLSPPRPAQFASDTGAHPNGNRGRAGARRRDSAAK